MVRGWLKPATYILVSKRGSALAERSAVFRARKNERQKRAAAVDLLQVAI